MKVAMICVLMLCVMLVILGVCALIWLTEPLIVRLAAGLTGILAGIAFASVVVYLLKDEW